MPSAFLEKNKHILDECDEILILTMITFWLTRTYATINTILSEQIRLFILSG